MDFDNLIGHSCPREGCYFTSVTYLVFTISYKRKIHLFHEKCACRNMTFMNEMGFFHSCNKESRLQLWNMAAQNTWYKNGYFREKSKEKLFFLSLVSTTEWQKVIWFFSFHFLLDNVTLVAETQFCSFKVLPKACYFLFSSVGNIGYLLLADVYTWVHFEW